jgi:hypothetical protein
MIIAAIDTPKLYANEYQVEKEEKKAESKIQ